MINKWLKNIGPGTLVAAAFIGPGTVTLCTLAGVHFGTHLLWAMLLSIFATITLQEMAARLGIISQKSLSEVLRNELKEPILRGLMIFLILSAIVIGNAAYEAGNISGSVIGIESVTGSFSVNFENFSLNFFSILIGFIAFGLLLIGNYKILERVLVILVLLMSISFVITAVITKPSLSAILKGVFLPTVPENSLFTIMGLIGTTVVPYNLFLHASLVKEKWKNKEGLTLAKKDTIISILMGGVVSMSIIISASGILSGSINNGADLALGLEPLYGSYSKFFLAIGLFAAGVTSSITAPLAAAFVVKGCLGWKGTMKSIKFKLIWGGILVLGVVFSSIGIKPIEIIKFAQVANGVLLPIIVGVLLWIMNKKNVLGKYHNTRLQNFIVLCILAITIFLGLRSILKVFNLL